MVDCSLLVADQGITPRHGQFLPSNPARDRRLSSRAPVIVGDPPVCSRSQVPSTAAKWMSNHLPRAPTSSQNGGQAPGGNCPCFVPESNPKHRFQYSSGATPISVTQLGSLEVAAAQTNSQPWPIAVELRPDLADCESVIRQSRDSFASARVDGATLLLNPMW
jgi:hypothetical protein